MIMREEQQNIIIYKDTVISILEITATDGKKHRTEIMKRIAGKGKS